TAQRKEIWYTAVASWVVRTNHKVNNDTGNGNIKPDRECDPGQPAVPSEIPGQRPDKGKQDQRNNTYRQQNVRQKHKKVHISDGSDTSKRSGIAGKVVDYVQYQEQGREPDANLHNTLMQPPTAILHGDNRRHQEN